jgi:hypothetical protein
MVSFNDNHKITIPSKNKVYFERITEVEEVDITKLSDNELFTLRASLERWYKEQMYVINQEIERWEPIYCSVCGQEDLAFRGRPFVTWGMRGGYPLCPRHTMRFDLMGTPEGEQLRKAKEEEREIKELFG